jgi:hypothetical protein
MRTDSRRETNRQPPPPQESSLWKWRTVICPLVRSTVRSNVDFVCYDLFHILLSCDKIMDPWNVYMYVYMYVCTYVSKAVVYVTSPAFHVLVLNIKSSLYDRFQVPQSVPHTSSGGTAQVKNMLLRLLHWVPCLKFGKSLYLERKKITTREWRNTCNIPRVFLSIQHTLHVSKQDTE